MEGAGFFSFPPALHRQPLPFVSMRSNQGLQNIFIFVLSSGWLASYVGQSEVPALITSLFSPPAPTKCKVKTLARVY